MKTFYLQVDENNIVRDAISYPYGNYIPFEAEMLPVGVNGGWFKFENGILVEYPELKPKDKDEEIEALNIRLEATELALLDLLLEGGL